MQCRPPALIRQRCTSVLSVLEVASRPHQFHGPSYTYARQYCSPDIHCSYLHDSASPISGGYTFLSLGTVTWHNTYAPPGRGPGLAKLLLTSKTPSVAPAILGPRRSPLDPRRHRQCAPVGLVAPVSGLLSLCHRAPGTRDLVSPVFLPQRVPALPLS